MPYHLLLDHAGEAQLGKLQIGTTRRGIGPCYADKAARLGIRMQDLLDEKILRQKIYAAMEPKRQTLRPFAKDPALDLHTMTEEYRTFGHRLEPYIADTPPIVWDALDRGGLVVFEGAQGTMLDIDHGTYPFVTSSNPVAGAACVGAGVGPQRHRRGLGRRQGLRHARRRRARSRPSSRTSSASACARPAASSAPPPGARAAPAGSTSWRSATRSRVNGLTGLVITKLDVLTGIDPLNVAVRYLGPEGATFDEFPYHQSILHKARRRLRGAARLARGHLAARVARGPARPTRRPTSTSSPTTSASRS